VEIINIMVGGVCLGTEEVPDTPAVAVTECVKKNPMSYLGWHERAETLHRQGARQQRCPSCRKVYWPFERDQHAFP